MSINELKVGMASAFTGKYRASKLIMRFLGLLDVKVVKTTITKPEMVEAGSTLASADFCLPLRAYVGHVYHLIQQHPDMDYIITPIIKGEHPASSTCAKYRDLDGVVIRSLGSITGYRLKQNSTNKVRALEELIGGEATTRFISKVNHLPKILAPEIESLEKEHLYKVCMDIYTNLTMRKPRQETNQKLYSAFEKAYQEIVELDQSHLNKLLNNPEKVRLALLGRNYLIDDPTLSANIKAYFRKHGVTVITMEDVPFEYMKNHYNPSVGFYDYHLIGQAFIDSMLEKVDGFIIIGSFGCHPDAFQIDHFSKYIAENGKAVWTFKFDEQTGGAGFHTRFETILGFLEQKRAERLKEAKVNVPPKDEFSLLKKEEEKNPPRPLFIWPHMGTGIDLIIKETWYQLGLDKYLFPPHAVDEQTIGIGNTEYTETCSPFALYLGSLRQSLDRFLASEQNDSPRRIIILMAGGKGPCTFGWYAIAGQQSLIKEYQERLKKYGHTLEMLAIDNQGRNLTNFLKDLAAASEKEKLLEVMEKLKLISSDKGNKITKLKEEIALIRLLKQLAMPGWKKLLAYEDLHNESLSVRAHELKRGETTKALKKVVKSLEDIHTMEEIESEKIKGIEEMRNIPQDNEKKPRVVVVGEIYVALTPFANRGTVDNLLGLHGIEAVEGMRLSHFIKGSLKGLKHYYLQNQKQLKPLIKWLEGRGHYKSNWVREPKAIPFLEHEIGGDGQPTVAHARHHIEEDGVDGILHIYPFKCMPEGIAKDALIEMSQLYGVKSLHLSFDKEIEIERLKTEIGTFAALLKNDLSNKKDNWKRPEVNRRQTIGETMDKLYYQRGNKVSFRTKLENRLVKNLVSTLKR